MNHSKKTISDEQLAGFILGDLPLEEYQNLIDLPAEQRDSKLNDLERIASSVALASIGTGEAMPEKLRVSVIETGRSLVAEINNKPRSNSVSKPSHQVGRARETIAWLACLAASVAAVFFWQSTRRSDDQTVAPVWNRDSLIASAPDLIRVPWGDGTTPWDQKVTGDVVWSDKLQRGYMRFVGMPVNDPTVEQYQLWIIDPSRDDEPIDGGVFDISSAGETVIPIQAKLLVNRPNAFAVTIEKPGGVVVSTQERLPLMATVRKPNWVRSFRDLSDPFLFIAGVD